MISITPSFANLQINRNPDEDNVDACDMPSLPTVAGICPKCHLRRVAHPRSLSGEASRLVLLHELQAKENDCNSNVSSLPVQLGVSNGQNVQSLTGTPVFRIV